MSKLPNFTLKIGRRDFITATMALTTCRAIGKVDAAVPAIPPISNAVVSTIPNPNMVIGGRIGEIARRNILRKESGLPLLSVPRELRLMKAVEAADNFAKFSEAFRNRVSAKTLARIRRRRGEPNWKPKGMQAGIGFENEVSKTLRRLHQRIG